MKKLFRVLVFLLICVSLSVFTACEKDTTLSLDLGTEIRDRKESETEIDSDAENAVEYNTLYLSPLYFNITETIINSETVFIRNTYDVYKSGGKIISGLHEVPKGYNIVQTNVWYRYFRQIKIEVSAKPAYKNAIFSGTFTFTSRSGTLYWQASRPSQTVDLEKDGSLSCVWDVSITTCYSLPDGYYHLAVSGNVKTPKNIE